MRKNNIFRVFKWFRVCVGVAVLTLSVLLFIVPGSPAAGVGGLIVRGQFIPAILRLTAPETLATGLLVLIAVLVLTMLCGRVYCSFLCPFGIMQDLLRRISTLPFAGRRRYRIQAGHLLSRRIFILLALFGICGGVMLPAVMLDPYSLFGRAAAGIMKPLAMRLTGLAAGADGMSRQMLLYFREMPPLCLLSSAVAALVSVVIVILVFRNGRIFCNTVCPVGALLGELSRHSLFRLTMEPSRCSGCSVCAGYCKTGCVNAGERTLDFSRCVMCFNCGAACRSGAVKMKFFLPFGKNRGDFSGADPGRRQFLIASGTAAAAVFSLRPLLGVTRPAVSPIMPPGARSRVHFQNRCVACHQCVSACPTGIIRPSGLEYGWGGMLMPLLDFRRGNCEISCNVCTGVCPSGALLPLDIAAKRLTRIGEAEYRRDHCLVLTRRRNCGACAANCPVGAINMVAWRGHLRIPVVDVASCIGCGSCEHICPASPKAIVVNGLEVHGEASRPVAFSSGESLGSDFPF